MEKEHKKTIEKLTEWLENNEIDHPDYDRKFAELKQLEEQENGGEQD